MVVGYTARDVEPDSGVDIQMIAKRVGELDMMLRAIIRSERGLDRPHTVVGHVLTARDRECPGRRRRRSKTPVDEPVPPRLERRVVEQVGHCEGRGTVCNGEIR